MRVFSQIITEARVNYDSDSLLQSEISKFITKVNKRIPKNVQQAIYLTGKWNITDPKTLDEIRTATKSKLPDLVKKLGIDSRDLEVLWSLMKDIKGDYKVMPQYLSKSEREALELGQLSMNDVTIDLKTPAGRNAAAKIYMPLVYKIVNQYIGKSRLNKSDLMSAALIGFTNAMNDWKGKDEEGKTVSFKTYAGYRIKQQILNDMDELGHTLSGTNWYATQKYGADVLDAISLDGLPRDADGDFKQDHLAGLGVEDKPSRDEEKLWDKLYKLIEKQFSQRDCDVFYRFFGLNGRKREKSKDIAKSYGMSEGNIRNSILNKIIKWLKSNNLTSDILSDIQDIYTESLMIEMLGMDRQQIIETLLADDTYLLLEELTAWKNRQVFMQSVERAMDAMSSHDQATMHDIIGGDFEFLDSNFKKDRKPIIQFLSIMYPTENISRKSDVDLLDRMQDIQMWAKKHKYI